MALSASARRLLSQHTTLIACNVYISAGGLPQHAPLLLGLLSSTQERCLRINRQQPSVTQTQQQQQQQQQTMDPGYVTVVHAYTDTVYNRSSFHLAATNERCLSDVVSVLVQDARTMLSEQQQQQNAEQEEQPHSHHPFVGLVDHISVMPLTKKTTTLTDSSSTSDAARTTPADEINSEQEFQPTTPSGRAARDIGRSMSNADVFYYGDADPFKTPLVEVRRKKTSFFKSGGLEETDTTMSSKTIEQRDVATVGAPAGFVENFNILLSQNCDKKRAHSLTKFLRERDGGLPGVEALTLPYSLGRYEVACNLLQPQIGSADAIETKLEEWARKVIQMKEEDRRNRQNNNIVGYYVEKAYRVGTTVDQCLEALVKTTTHSEEDPSALVQHNRQVWTRFDEYLRLN